MADLLEQARGRREARAESPTSEGRRRTTNISWRIDATNDSHAQQIELHRDQGQEIGRDVILQ